MKRFRLTILLVAILAVFGTVMADEVKTKKKKKGAGKKAEEPVKDPAEVKRQKKLEFQAKTSLKIFAKEFKSKTLGKRIQAVFDLAKIHHDLVIDELGKKALFDKNEEVRDATAQLFGDEFSFNKEKAGAWLKKALPKNEDYPEVQLSIIRSIGKIGYLDALQELKDAAEHLNEEKYRWVTVEVVRTFGVIEDKRCLPFLLWMSEYGGRALKWSTGEVKVDKTRAGDADQREAEAKWKAKYGHVKPKKPPAPLIRTYMQELRKVVQVAGGARRGTRSRSQGNGQGLTGPAAPTSGLLRQQCASGALPGSPRRREVRGGPCARQRDARGLPRRPGGHGGLLRCQSRVRPGRGCGPCGPAIPPARRT
jgi:hypothetical protein